MEKNVRIAQIGESILRKKATPVTKIDDRKIVDLIETLIDTAINYQGVGIAAPQISQPYRLFIVASRPSDRYPHAPTMQPTAMINPRILDHNLEIEKDWEGCLSIPDVRGLVPRYKEIEVEYTNKEGETKQEILTGFVARIFQHELDHLDGIVFTDRVENEADLYTEAEYRQIINN
ncbi:peptide deformylase [Waterburya agarophytonicola K14]|uniref:Peptide deformylase n=1 Tax=Waterburya agarophytonicola KI4 TaxID=2874699 RepID=A0A964FKU1_9CYAN|nr:peptide deformylase [Waterburya agarophytonicola]MCC0179414.1 peptide deformylase [Waterburya agarophytonicola KI4]